MVYIINGLHLYIYRIIYAMVKKTLKQKKPKLMVQEPKFYPVPRFPRPFRCSVARLRRPPLSLGGGLDDKNPGFYIGVPYMGYPKWMVSKGKSY